MLSAIHQTAKIQLPEFKGERYYMVPFMLGDLLPDWLAGWQQTVTKMVKGIKDSKMPAFLTIDQRVVPAGKTHRNPGAHIDGNYRLGRWDTGPGPWKTHNLAKGGVILVADVTACEAYTGEIDAAPAEKGSCEHIDLSPLNKVTLEANKVYVGNVNMIHKPLPLAQETKRTLVRITLPEDFEYAR